LARFRDTITSPMSAEDAFDYMAEFSNVSAWDPTAAEAHPIGGNEAGGGARFHVLVRWLGREIPLEYTTTDYERPRRVVLHAENRRRSPRTRSRSSRPTPAARSTTTRG